MAQPAHGRCRLMLLYLPAGKTTMDELKKPTKTTDKKVWEKPRKVTIFLTPTYRKPVAK
jgi:hypothetical protein